MKFNKPSTSSRASVRSLIVACLPAAAVAFVANSPALGAALRDGANHGLTVDDNSGASTNGANTNGSNGDWPPERIAGQRG